MNKKNQYVVRIEPVEFEKQSFETGSLDFHENYSNLFRGLYGICLKLMKENQKITPCDRLALETPLASRPIMHAQKSPWTLDAGHVVNLNEGKLL